MINNPTSTPTYITYDLHIENTSTMEHLGACISNYVRPATSLWLQGPLGAGKTTLCRGLIKGLGYEYAVKSPTFTLVNSYTIGDLIVHHFDFYRVSDPYEFDLIGGHDYFTDNAFCVIEWPQHAEKMLQAPALCINLEIGGTSRKALIKSNSVYPVEKIIEDFKS